MHRALPPTDTDAPISHFSNCHTGILAQLARLGDLTALLGPAAQARKIAQESLAFFNEALFGHHNEEEKDLFPAVSKSAQAGAERLKVDGLIEQLTHDHRALEKLWKSLEPGLRKVAKGQDSTLDVLSLGSMVQRYQAHARLEEQAFLPLAQTILGRRDQHMAALGLTLHMRHVPDFVAYI
jgi:iron-sulfur cluster repair protein YtfE (RIC family)